MRGLTRAETNRLWKEVREEFPDDPMMQEIHFIRLVHHHQMERMSPKKRVLFYGRSAERTGV